MVFLLLPFVYFTEHVWHVSLQKKGLGEKQNLHGPFRLRLTDKTLSMTKITNEQNSDYLEFPVSLVKNIAKVGLVNFFFLLFKIYS